MPDPTQNYTFLDDGIFFTYAFPDDEGIYTPVPSVTIATPDHNTNVYINAVSVTLQNTTSWIRIKVPTIAQRESGNFFLNANSEWTEGGSGGQGYITTPGKCYHSNTITLYGNTNSIFTKESPADSYRHYEIPLPYTYHFQGGEWGSVFIHTNGTLTFGPPDHDILDRIAPSVINAAGFALGGATGMMCDNYYYGEDGTKFVIRFEGTDPYNNKIAWEVTLDSANTEVIKIAADDTIMTGPMNIWGAMSANQWLDVFNSLPTPDYNGYDYIIKPTTQVTEFIFIGENVDTCIDGDTAYININPFKNIFEIQSTANNTVLSSDKAILFNSSLGMEGQNREFTVGNSGAIVLNGSKGANGQAIVSNGTISSWDYVNYEKVKDKSYDLGGFCYNSYNPGEILFQFMAVRPFRLEADFIGSRAISTNRATQQTTFGIYKNEVRIGSLSFTSLSDYGVFLSFNQDVTIFEAGDYLRLEAPMAVDQTLGDFSYTFKARVMPLVT